MRAVGIGIALALLICLVAVPARGEAASRAIICTSSVGRGSPPPSNVPSRFPGFHASWYGQSGHLTLCPGTRGTAAVTYYNSGSLGWAKGRPGQAAYLGTFGTDPGQDQPSVLGGDGARGSPSTGWPRYDRVAEQPRDDVAPGQVATFQFSLQAPSRPGRYRLSVRPLIEGVTWMEDVGVYWQVTVPNPDGSPVEPVPDLPDGVRFQIAGEVLAQDLWDIRTGIARAGAYLGSIFGDRPRRVTVHVQAGTSPFCCTAGGGPGAGVISIDVRHAHWQPPRAFEASLDHQKHLAHEYAHTWQYDVGCRVAPIWLVEGMAEYVAYQSLITQNALDQAEVDRFLLHVKSAPLQVPLQSLETEFPAEAYPYSLAHLAVARLARSGGPAALKAFCRAGGRTAWRDAFRRSFGFDVATFYAQFEAHRRAF